MPRFFPRLGIRRHDSDGPRTWSRRSPRRGIFRIFRRLGADVVYDLGSWRAKNPDVGGPDDGSPRNERE